MARALMNRTLRIEGERRNGGYVQFPRFRAPLSPIFLIFIVNRRFEACPKRAPRHSTGEKSSVRPGLGAIAAPRLNRREASGPGTVVLASCPMVGSAGIGSSPAYSDFAGGSCSAWLSALPASGKVAE